MKSPPRARSPTLLRILLYSGFGAKCGAPHFVPLLLRPQHAGAPFIPDAGGGGGEGRTAPVAKSGR